MTRAPSNPGQATPAAPRVVVVGTLNVDLVCRVPLLPRPGGTIIAESVVREFGGKGANQAVAAARQDASVVMVGAVGDDDDGRQYRAHLQRERIDASRVAVLPRIPTGTAHVYVDGQGENSIVVNRGANGLLNRDLVRRSLGSVLGARDVLLVQLECPLEAAVEALRIAGEHGARAILNASPVCAAFPWGDHALDVIVNEHECRECFARPPEELTALDGAARRRFLGQFNLRNLVVSQGREPTLWFSSEASVSIPTHPVVPRDTVGAGDTLAGVLAARLAEGLSWPAALRHANVAAALSTLAVGAQNGMPTQSDVSKAMVAA